MLTELILKFQYWLEGDLQAKKAEVRAAANQSGGSFYFEILADTERCPQCRQITLALVRYEEGDLCHRCWKDHMAAAHRRLQSGHRQKGQAAHAPTNAIT